MGICEKTATFVARSTGIILVLVALLFTLAITQIIDLKTGQLRIEIDPSANRLISQDDPAKLFYDNARRIFGSDETLVITLTSDNVFTHDTLERIDRMTRRISQLDSVHHVVSLTNALDIRSTEDGLDIAPFIENIADDAADMDAVRERVLANPIYRGSLVSAGGDTTALIVYFHDISDSEFLSQGIHDQIMAITGEEKGDNEVWLTGAPHFKVSLMRTLIHELIWTPPLIALVLAVILALFFRTVLGVVAPLLTVAVGVIMTLGVIAGMGYSLSMISVLVPPLLMILGLSYSVHVVSEYHQQRDTAAVDKTDLVGSALKQVTLPVALTGLTTMAGFVALIVNPITAVKEFGIFAVIGVMIITLLSISFTPALLKLLDWKGADAIRHKDPDTSPFDRFVDRIAVFDLNRRIGIFTVTGLLFALALYGMTNIKVSTDFMASFAEDSEVRTGFNVVNEKLGGANPLYIVVEGTRPNIFKEPANLEIIRELQDWLVSQPEIGSTTSVVDYLMLVNQALHDNDPAFYSIPDNRRRITQLIFLSSNDELDRIVDSRYQTTNIVLRSRIFSSEDMAALIERTNARLKELPEHLTATITGNPVLLNNTLASIVTGQAKSVGLALLIVYAILSLMFMSLRIGMVALVPNLVPVGIYFGSLGFFGISLNPGTSLIAPMVLGIAIDDTIHYFSRFSQEVKRVADDRKATVAALKAVGRPVTYTSTGLFLGFLVLLTSDLSMQAQVGIMASYALAVAWLSDFILTPALCSSVRITTLWDVLTLDLGENPQESIPLLKGLRNSQARILALMSRIVTVPAGKRVITNGNKGTQMYVVIDGSLTTSFDGENGRVQVATHTRGDIVGETGLFYEKRTADVDATEDSRLLSLTQDNLERLSRRYPYIASKVFRNMNEILARRLFKTTHRLG